MDTTNSHDRLWECIGEKGAKMGGAWPDYLSFDRIKDAPSAESR